MSWTCPECKFQLTVDKLFYPVICPCGLIDKGNGVIDHVSKIVPKIQNNPNVYNKPIVPRKPPVNSEQLKNAQGRNSWKILHSYVGCDPQWFRLWLLTLPKDCPCNSKFKTLLNQYPPNFSSPENFWLWGHFIHNEVNAKLREEGKERPHISIEEANRQWKTLYALWQPIEYGGMERWSITLSKKLPAFGVVPKDKNYIPDLSIRNDLISIAPLVTIEDVVYHEKQIISSFITDQPIPPRADIISVAHGNCKWTKNYIEKVVGHTNSFVGVSSKTAKLVHEWTGKDCAIIENGVDTDTLIPTMTRDEMRREFGIPNDAFVIGYTGRTTEEKQIPLLLQAASKIPNAWVLIVGWSSQIDHYSIAQSLGIADRVRMVPPVQGPIANALIAMDVFSFLSREEGFGLSVMEALMFGLPVATTDVGVVTELRLKHGEFIASILSPEASAYEVADAIKRAERCTVDLSFYTADAMANRWKAYLESRK